MRDRGLERRFERFRRKGDVTALGRVFDGAAPELLRVATNLASGLSEAEDLVQATFLTAIERAPSWDRSARLMPWLLGILVRHAHEARRAKAREEGEPSLELVGSQRAPHEDVQDAELSASVRAALGTIPEPYRAVLRPFLVEGRGALEIAHATGRAPGTVRMQIHRGLDRLRRALPAGLGVALGLQLDTGRGLAAMRLEVLTQAAASPAALAAASASIVGTSFFGTSSLSGILGSLTLVKNLSLAAVAVALSVGVAWIAWPDAPSETPAHVAPGAAERELEHAPAPEPETALPVSEAFEGTRAEPGRLEAKSSAAHDSSASLYARSLAGVQGRLLNHRAEPVPNTELTLLEIHPGMFLRAYEAIASGEPPAWEIEVQRARTDEEGRFRLHGVRTSGLHALGVDLGGPRATIVSLEHVLNSGETVELGEVVLEPTGRVHGRVVDEAGQPVAGARVRAGAWPAWVDMLSLYEWRRDAALSMSIGEHYITLELPAWVHAWESRLPIPTAVSAADGSFVLEAVPVGRVAPLVDRAGRPACKQPEVTVTVNGDHDVGALVLAAGRDVRGRVVDSSGEPIADAAVRVGALADGWEERYPFGAVLRPEVRTDAEGRFKVAGLPAELKVIVAARRAEGLAWIYEVGYDPAGDPLELSFATEAELSLSVRGPNGAPVEGAMVSIAPTGPMSQHDMPAAFSPLRPCAELERPEPGVLRLRRLARGPHQVLVTAPGFARASFEQILKAGANEHELQLVPNRALRVRVVANESGEPLEHAAVSVHFENSRDPAVDGGKTDAAGQVVLSRVPNHGAGEALLLRVEHPGFALQRTVFEPDAEELEVRLSEGGSMLAEVRRHGRVPDEPVFMEVQGRLVKGFDVIVYGATDLNGELRIERLMPGSYSYRLSERYLEQGAFGLIESFDDQPERLSEGEFEVVEGEVTRLSIELDAPNGVPAGTECSLSGRFTLDGEPIAKLEMMLTSWGGQEVPDAQQQTSGRGEYEYDGLAPGSYFLVCMSAGSSSAELGGRFQHFEEVKLAAGEQRLLDFDWRSHTLEVFVSDARGGPAAEGVTVVLRVRNGGESATTTAGVTDEGGVAHLRVFGGGEYELSASHPQSGTGKAEGVLGPAEERLSLQLELGVPCAGMVTAQDSNGVLVNGSGTLIFSSSEELYSRHAEVEFDASRAPFELAGLEPGTYQITLRQDGRRFYKIELVLEQSGSADIALEFTERPTNPGRKR